MNSPDLETRQYYERWHQDLEVDREAGGPWHDLVREYLDPDRDVAGKTVLEIGCGRGGLACWLGSLPNPSRQIVAIDYAHSAVHKARAFAESLELTVISWAVGDIQSIAHADQSFDTVISCETVEHVPDPGKAVAELARVLKRGGKLLLTTPNYLGPYGLYRMYLRLRGRRFTEVGQPINNVTLLPRTIRWISKAGLRIIAVDAVGHYLMVPGRAPIRLERFSDPRFIVRWFGLHSIVVAQKP
jgi:2-polyprenyl-3-methyl-5-hydroxy-6-metoxy-1,4-benzoquinol methylase